MSIDQLIQTCQNAIRISKDPQFAFRTGTTLHLSAYGMYGFAILSGTDYQKSAEFALQYHALASPLVSYAFFRDKDKAIWTIDPIAHPNIDGRLYEFIVEFQLGINLTLHRDIMGGSFSPCKVLVSFEPEDRDALSEALGCPVLSGAERNEFSVDASWYGVRPLFAHISTHAELVAVCDDLLARMRVRTGVAGQLREMLIQNVAAPPPLDTCAHMLGVTARTLRRQLKQQDTSFRELLDEVRCNVAVRYLLETKMTIENIAFSLGFSDASNFRQAFRRWTKRTPNAFRRQR